ncbi:DUF2147 domain-containing protein [Pseudopontixanthobacter vadosimaris]|uniref:DUF2147 domain-containing protein n=1 Tax=Pseudopontixanthobacter vadosimaris TaxID=2726450 RepID=UPI0014767472|nr:DUF2147 domain-containing protein [Pseudopontixanthobacter vadosimaris]
MLIADMVDQTMSVAGPAAHEFPENSCMRMIVSFLAAGLAMLPASAIAAPADITGKWKTDDGRAVVEFYRCGDAMCGRISDFLVPEPAGGVRDTENPDAAKRSRKLRGLRIFWGLAPDGDRYEGKGYSPEDGRYFNADVYRSGTNLRIKGCIAAFLCRSQTWKPA